MKRKRPRGTDTTRREVLAFLQAIKEDPQEDMHRLVLADWLEEYGTEVDRARGQLLRVQCESTRLSMEPNRRWDCEKEVRVLQETHGRAWLGPLAAWVGRDCWSHVRGLLRLRVNARTFFTRRRRAYSVLKGTETWGWVDGLSLADMTDERAPFLASSSLLDGINNLSLRGAWLEADAIRLIVSSNHLRNLITLDLSHNRTGVFGARALGNSAALTRLQTLDLVNNGLGADALHAFLAAPHLKSLSSLNLSGNRILGGDLEPLAEVPPRKVLRHLDLSHNRLGPEGGEELGRIRALAGLRHLQLAQTQLGDSGVCGLARSTHLTALTELDLSGNQMGTEGIEALTNGILGTTLKKLILTDNHIGDQGMVLLAGATQLKGLTTLHLEGCWIGDRGAEALIRSPTFRKLQTLRVQRNLISSQTRNRLRDHFQERVQM